MQEEEPAFSYFHFEFFGAAPKARTKTEPAPEPQPQADPRSPLNEKNEEPAAPGALTMSDEVVQQVGLAGEPKTTCDEFEIRGEGDDMGAHSLGFYYELAEKHRMCDYMYVIWSSPPTRGCTACWRSFWILASRLPVTRPQLSSDFNSKTSPNRRYRHPHHTSHVAHECSHVYRGGHSSTNMSTVADLIRMTPLSMFKMRVQVKKQYLHLSKSVHPDKTDRRREGAFTRRFQMLGKAKGVFIHR